MYLPEYEATAYPIATRISMHKFLCSLPVITVLNIVTKLQIKSLYADPSSLTI